MMQNANSRGTMAKRVLGFVLTLCVALSVIPLQLLAAEKKAYLIHNSTLSYYDSFSSAWRASANGDTVGILQDTELSGNPPTLTSGTRTVELNGHRLYRHNSKAHDNGEMFLVKNGAELDIYGGRLNWDLRGNTVYIPIDETDKISGKYYNENGFASESGTESVNLVFRLCYFDYSSRKILYANEKSEYPVYGGLINGGWSTTNGGAIRMMGKNTSVSLYDVTLAGNIAEDNGGAIAMYDDYQKLRMTDSRIAYNLARKKNGGGIYINGNYSKVYMANSHIDYNLADDNGGAIAIYKQNVTIAGDAEALEPTDSAYPANWKNSTYTANPYAMMNGSHNPFWDRNENSSSKHVSTENRASTVAYNIVTNSDFNGGGAIYIDGKNASVGGLNIMKNLALGFGLDATMCGRGAGVMMATEGNTLSNCNIWKNWSRSEGGGVFVDNDKCALTDVTVTGNYSYTDGLSGGGVYVLGTVNLSVGGRCIIKDNASDGRKKDNLYLGYYNFMFARLYVSLTKGSEVSVLFGGKAADITKVAGDYDERMFYSDDDGYHIEYKDQILVKVAGLNSAEYIAQKYPEIPVQELVPENPIAKGSRTKKLAETYTSAYGNTYPLYQGIAEFPSFLDADTDLASTFFYSDGYFDRNPQEYDSHLATMSLHLAIAGFYSNDGNEGSALYNADGNGTYYPAKSNNIRQFMNDIGVAEKDIYLNDYYVQKPESFSIGVAFGSKTITLGGVDKKLVIVGVRGAGYEQEWVSNLTLGSEGEAKGFASAADKVFNELYVYLRTKGIDGYSEDTIFWVAGYSRAGATSNLTGARIVDSFDPFGSHTFVYTFEAPQGGMSTVRENTDKYYCIHNVINNADLVPQVGPSAMGFHRYGVDHYVPGTADSSDIRSSAATYMVADDAGTGAKKVTYTTWYDNTAYTTDSSAYKNQKKKMQTQLKDVAGYDIAFNDYFHAATISYMGNTVFGSYGWQMISEDSDSQTSLPQGKRNAAGFTEFFLKDLQEKALNFIADEKGNKMNGLYRTAYSKATFDGISIEQAAANAAGVVFGMTGEQMQAFMELAGTLTDRFNTTSLYTSFLNTDSDPYEFLATYSENPALMPVKVYSDIGEMPMRAYHMMMGYKTAGQIIEEIWNAINVPTDEQMQNRDTASKYLEGRAKGYLYLQDILTDEQIATLRESIPTLGILLLDYLKKDYKETGNDVLGTLVYNVTHIMSNHYPEVSLAWVRSYDSYYDRQNTQMVMAESTKVKKVSAPVANGLEATKITLTRANPTLELHVPGDENQGAGIFYRFTGKNAPDTDLHPYCAPLYFEAEGDAPESYTIETYAIHDGIRSKTRTLQITVGDSCLLAYTYQDVNGNEVTEYISMQVGNTYTLERFPALPTLEFKNWIWTSGNQNGLEGFDIKSRANTFTVKQKGTYSIKATYFEKSNAVQLTIGKISENTLPNEALLTGVRHIDSSEMTDIGSVSVPVSWSKIDGNTYVATVYLPKDTVNMLCYSGQRDDNSVTAFDSLLEATVNSSEYNRSGSVSVEKVGKATGIANVDGSAEVRQTFRITGYTDHANIRALTIKFWDENTRQMTTLSSGDSDLICGCLKGEPVIIPAPAVTSEKLIGIRSAEGISADAVSITGGMLQFMMPDNDVTLVLAYRPTVYNLTIAMDGQPTGGEKLPAYRGLVATIENNWAITEGISAKWSVNDTIAKYNTEYSIRLSLDEASMKGLLLRYDGTAWDTVPGDGVALAGAFDFADETVIRVVTPSGEAIPCAAAIETAPDGTISVNVVFEATGPVPVVSVNHPDPVSVPYGSTAQDMQKVLPETVTVQLADGTVGEAAVNWEKVNYVPGSDTESVVVIGKIVPNPLYDLSYYKYTEGVIDILPADRTDAPTAGLIVYGVKSDAGSYGEPVIIEETENYSVKLVLSANSDAVIRYSLNGEAEEEYSEPVEIGWGEGIDPGSASKTVTVQTYASKDGNSDSALYTYTYTLTAVSSKTPDEPPVDPPDEPPVEPPVDTSAYTIAENGETDWKKGSGEDLVFSTDAPLELLTGIRLDGETLSKNSYVLNAQASKIALRASYLDKLDVGTHTIEIVMPDGSAEATFTVAERPPYVPATEYTVSFVMNGHGLQIDARTVREGTPTREPMQPSAYGFTFAGWYTDETLETAFDFSAAITADTILYAKWTEEDETEPPEPAESSEPDETSQSETTSDTKHTTSTKPSGKSTNSNYIYFLWAGLAIVIIFIPVILFAIRGKKQ